MPHQTSSMLDHHTGQGGGWWRTLLQCGVVVLRFLLCIRLAKALVLPLMDFVGVHSSEPSPSPVTSVNEEAVSLVNETEEPLTYTVEKEEIVTCDWDADKDRRLAKGKMQVISDGSITRSSEDEVGDDDDDELKQAMVESIRYHRGLEEWVRFRTPGATFHRGETSGAITSSSDPSELRD